MEFNSTNHLANIIKFSVVDGGYYSKDYGNHEVMNIKARTTYAKRKDIIIICNATDLATVKIAVSDHNSYDEQYWNTCLAIYEEMSLGRTNLYYLMGWNERVVIYSDIKWKYANKENLAQYIEDQAKLVDEFQKRLSEYGYIDYEEIPSYELENNNHFASMVTSYKNNNYSRGLYISGNRLKGIGDCKDDNIVIPRNVVIIDDEAFNDCKEIKSVVIPNTVKIIGSSSFRGCSGIDNIEIPDSVERIEEDAFTFCSQLKEIIIPNSIKVIEEKAFWACEGLRKVVVPGSIKTINRQVFWGCKNLTEVIIEEGVLTIGSHAFSSCNNLKNIVIPESVEEIGDYAFESCSSLVELKIPDGVERIESGAFESCYSLKKIFLPYTIYSIGDYAFENCFDLECIIFDGSIEDWEEIDKGDGWCDSVDETCVIKCNDGEISIEEYLEED